MRASVPQIVLDKYEGPRDGVQRFAFQVVMPNLSRKHTHGAQHIIAPYYLPPNPKLGVGLLYDFGGGDGGGDFTHAPQSL